MLTMKSDFFLGHFSVENYLFYFPKFPVSEFCKQLDLFKFAIEA